MGRCQVTTQNFVGLQMPRTIWAHFEDMSQRDTNRYVAAIPYQLCAFVENERRQCDTVAGAMHLYTDAVYAVYCFAFQLELLGVIRPNVRRNCEVAAFRGDVRLWDQPSRARRTMLCQFLDGEFVPEDSLRK